MVCLKKFRAMIMICCLIMTGLGYSEPDLKMIKQKIRQALLNSEYYGEYTETDFKFSRRQEVTYRVWAGDGFLAREVQSPAWQHGEIALIADQYYYYCIPDQNCGLKIMKKVAKHPILLPGWWRGTDELITLQAGSDAVLLNRQCLVFQGVKDHTSFKLWVSQDHYFPLAMEAYHDELLVKSIRFNQLDELPANFNPLNLLPGVIKWYDDEDLFWQTVSIPRLKRGVNFPILQPAYLPDGFTFKTAAIEELSLATVVHLVCESPDKQVISIFERGVSDRQKWGLEALKQVIARNGLPAFAYLWKNQVQIVVIGPLAQEELKKVAVSVK